VANPPAALETYGPTDIQTTDICYGYRFVRSQSRSRSKFM